jgi:hypothetical protein
VVWNRLTFYLDAIGIIKSVGALSIVREKVTLKQLSIVRLLLCDSTGNMEVNLWNDIVRILFKVFMRMIIRIIFYNNECFFLFVI